MNIDKLKDTFKRPRMTPAARWALTGGRIGGLVGLGPLGSSAGYAANKGVSNALSHIGARNPFGYTLAGKTKGLTAKQVLKYMVTTPTLETIEAQIQPYDRNPVATKTRAELLARGFNVFSDSKGSLLQPLTAETRAGLAAPVRALAEKNSTPSKVMEFGPDYENDMSVGSILGKFFYAGPEGQGVAAHKGIPVGASYYDKWDFDLHKGEKFITPRGIEWSNIIRYVVDKTLSDPVTVVGVNKTHVPR